MKQSVTYYLTLFVIKVKGLKKKFSQDPIQYQSIRKEDVLHPKGVFLKKYGANTFQILESNITEISFKSNPNKLLLFVHGGAFISGPGQHHWDTVKTIAKETDYTVWLCNYPKAPEHKISEISTNIDTIYREALKSFDSTQITCIGDSVGGTLIASMTQRLIKNEKPLPNKLILVSPVMDASFTNKTIEQVDLKDPMLSKKGLLSAKKMCIENGDLQNPQISPLYGTFKSFPRTTLFIAENDITYPDQLLAIKKMKDARIDIDVIEGKNMPHIWPFLPIMKEAKLALSKIVNILNNSY